MSRALLSMYVLWLQRVAQWCAARGWHDTAIGLFHSCLGWMQRDGDPKGEGIMHHNLGLAHQMKSDVRGAMVHYTRALSLEERAGDHAHLAQTLLALGKCHRELVDYDKARACFARAYLFAIQAEFPAAQAASCQFAAELAEHESDWSTALDQWGRLARIGLQHEQPRMAALAANQRARLHLILDAPDEARQEADGAREIAETIHDSYNLGLASATLGELAMLEQSWSKALELLTKAEKLLARQVSDDAAYRIHRGLAKVHQALGNEAEARRYYEAIEVR